MKRVEVWVPDEQFNQFEKLWKSKYGSRAEAVRAAMRDFIEEEEGSNRGKRNHK